MAHDIADLIERTTAKYSLINVSLSFNGPEPSAPEYLWGCSAQWPSDGDGGHNGRGIASAYGADAVSAILNCVGLIAIKQDGPLPVRSPLELAA